MNSLENESFYDLDEIIENVINKGCKDTNTNDLSLDGLEIYHIVPNIVKWDENHLSFMYYFVMFSKYFSLLPENTTLQLSINNKFIQTTYQILNNESIKFMLTGSDLNQLLNDTMSFPSGILLTFYANNEVIPLYLKENDTSITANILVDTMNKLKRLKQADATTNLVVKAVKKLVNFSDVDDSGSLLNNFLSYDERGYNLIHYCVLHNIPDVIKLILSSGLTLDTLTRNKSSCLHLAVETGNLKLCQLVYQYSTLSANVKNLNNETPLDVARRMNLTSIVVFLENHLLLSNDELQSPTESVHFTPSSTESDDDVNVLSSTLDELSLKQKCALSMSVALGENKKEIKDFVKKNVKNYVSAIRAMNNDERKEIEQEAKLIKKNFREWLLKTQVDSTAFFLKQLNRNEADNLSSSSVDVHEVATKVQAVGKGFIVRKQYRQRKEEIIIAQKNARMLLAKHNFSKLQRQIKSILIIQKSVRAHQQKKRKRKS